MNRKTAFKPSTELANGSPDSSNPSGSTLNTLEISTLQMVTDNTRTKISLHYKIPEIYDGGGDLKKQWFVFYSYLDPATDKFKRFKVYQDINMFHTVGERRSRAIDIQVLIKNILSRGFNPFERSNDPLLYGSDKQIESCILQYLATIADSGLSRHTKRKYKYELTIFKDWLIERNLNRLHIAEVKKQQIREFIDYLKKERSIGSGKTINHYLNDIRTFFNYYIDNFDDFLTRNPASKISSERVIVKGNKAYTEKEFQAVKELILKEDPYLWLICQVVYYSALRNESEALNIKVGDFDLKNNRIQVSGEIAKARKQQSIPIYPEFKIVLNELNLGQYPPEYYLFGKMDKPGIKRVGEDNFARRFRVIKKALGLNDDYGIYSFKHTRACHLYDDGADLREIQTLFRHEDLYVTMNYLRTLNRVERDKSYIKGRSI